MSDPYLNKQIVYIDSHNKQSGETYSDFTQVINLDKEVDQVCVLRAVIKKSYYLVQSGQNTFTLQEGSSTATITVPEGNYSASSFRLVLTGLLNGATMNGWTYSIALPNPATEASTGKYTFSCSGGNPSFIFTTYMYEQCGFEMNSTNTFTSNTLTSTTLVNFQLKDTLRIHSNIVTDSNTDILQEVTASSNSDFSSIRYECLDIQANSKPFNIKTNTFRFRVLDEDERVVNLSSNILLTLLFYRKNTVVDQANKLSIDFTKYQMLLKK